ncbi:prevent-host-death family protein [Anaerobacterium chartisolvens]|uniref:Antitoxin n=1 Tax=Anaerobacterium chartisolvens TaxID=1297424 RepID=A0A369BCL9_9FIRM|nr:type II toxin-antitoxin system prevent-host-death family antitoxin [Anaerobacterium chartisolvens]RCX19290.1 prevent-host-death family protein [Anaerobacterium chartisolvens]
MMVTSTEFKLNLGRYLELASKEEIIITKNGHRIAKLVADEEDLVSVAQSLFGIAANVNFTDDKIKEERIKDRYGVEFND